MKQTENNLICEVIDPHESIIQEVSKEMVEDDRAMDLADLFKMFSDSTRLKILYALSVHEMCVCDLAELLHMGQSAISHQLRLLRTSKLVKARREKKSVFYSLDDSHVGDIIKIGYEHVMEEADHE